LQQKNSSKAELVSVSIRNKFPLTKPFSEKYLKKLMGKNDIEDALKRLDRLTQEEARMAAAQLLKVTNTINSEVREIADNMLVVDDRVAGVDERVASANERVAGVDEHVASVDERVADVDERVTGVDERVAGVDERVAGVDDRVKDVDDRVKAVDDKLVAVLDGAQYIFNLSSKSV
jgi:methyl-accepting chemotaxis protein